MITLMCMQASACIHIKVTIIPLPFTFKAPLVALKATHTVNLRLIRKLLVDFI